MELIIEHGINHIDTAASYGDAELRLGPWMETHRDQFFLATKTGERTRAKAYEEIQLSLERLRTDHIDLIQLHNLVDADEWETAFATGGAIEAVVQAQADGLVSYIGVTGHGLTVAAQHLRSLEQYPFDAVLLPYNYPMSLNCDLPGRIRCAGRAVPGARRGGPDDQGDHPRAVGRSRADRQHLVRTAHRPSRHRHGRQLGPRPRGRLPEHRRRHRDPAEGPGRRRAVHRAAHRRPDARVGHRLRTRAPLRLTRLEPPRRIHLRLLQRYFVVEGRCGRL